MGLHVNPTRELFEKRFMEKLATVKGSNTVVLDVDEYVTICEAIQGWNQLTGAERSKRNTDVGGNRVYRWAKRFHVRSITNPDTEDVEFQLMELACREADPETEADPADASQVAAASQPQVALDSKYRIVLHMQNMYAHLVGVHEAGGHCKARSFEMKVKAKYARIPRWVLELICETCPICVSRVNRKPASAGHQPILTRGFGSRGQIDLIDMQSCKDGDYKFLLNYQDHGLKFYDNRPLTSKRAGEQM